MGGSVRYRESLRRLWRDFLGWFNRAFRRSRHSDRHGRADGGRGGTGGGGWQPVAIAVLASVLLVVAVWQLLVSGREFLQEVGELFGGTRLGDVEPFLLYTVAVGFLAMAAIELARKLYPFRAAFHDRLLRQWLGRGISVLLSLHKQGAGEVDESEEKRRPKKWPRDPLEHLAMLESRALEEKQGAASLGATALEDLLRLAVARRRVELLDLPIEELCGQVSAAAERLLEAPYWRSSIKGEHWEEFPDRQQKLLAGLAGAPGVPYAYGYFELEKERLVEELEYFGLEKLPFEERRSLLAQHIQRNIDGLQITARHRWGRRLRWSALAICMVVSVAVVFPEWNAGEASAATLSAAAVILGTASGFMATLARDVVAMIERWRRH